MRVQTQNNKNQESTIFFKKAKLQSAISKCTAVFQIIVTVWIFTTMVKIALKAVMGYLNPYIQQWTHN